MEWDNNILYIIFSLFVCSVSFIFGYKFACNQKDKEKINNTDILKIVTDTLSMNNDALDNKFSNFKQESFQMTQNVFESVNRKIDSGLNTTHEAVGKVNEKMVLLEESNKVIGELSNNVVGLENVLSNKQSRGAFGEVQLESIVSNYFSNKIYSMQYQLSNSSRVDCGIFLPSDIVLCIDSKFPFESFRKIRNADDKSTIDKISKQFKIDVKKHIDAISNKYIIESETAEYAIMFIPAESVFMEIISNFYDLIEYAQSKKVMVVSPTTIATVMTTAHAVIKDDRLKREIKKIKNLITNLLKDGDRFKSRYESFKTRHKQMGDDMADLDISADKIITKCKKIEDMDVD